MKYQYVTFLILLLFHTCIIKAEDSEPTQRTSVITSIDSLHSLSTALVQENPQQSILFAKEALNLATKINDQEKISISLRKIGEGHLNKGEHHSALNYLYRSLKNSRTENYKTGIIHSLDDIGILYFSLGEYQNSLFYLLESLKISKEIHDKTCNAFTLNKIGNVYQKLSNHQIALKYYQEALEIQESSGEVQQLTSTLNNIGSLHYDRKKYDDAISFYEKSIELSEDNGYKKTLPEAYKGLALINEELKKHHLAKQNYLYALQLSVENHDKINVSEVYFHLARLSFESKNYEEALDLNFQSYEIALDMSAKERIMNNYNLYAKIYSMLKDYEGAYSYLSKANTLKELIFNENISRSLIHIQMAEEEAKYRQMLFVKDAEIEAGKSKATFLTIILFLLLILSILIYLMYNVKNKKQKELSVKNIQILNQNKEIEEQKEVLEDSVKELQIAHLLINEQNQKLSTINEQLDELVKIKTTELVKTNEKLKSALKELDTFIYKTSHDIKGPLARLMGLCNVALLDIKHKKSVEYFEMLNVTANYLNSTLVRLLTVIDIKNNEIKKVKINFIDLINEILNNNSIHEGYDKIRFDIKIDKNVNFKSDPVILNLILHNLLENSIKYYKKYEEPNPFISLTVKVLKNVLQINIVDNGMGINRENLNLFEIFSRASNDSHAAGLGLYMIKVCVEKLGGTIELLNNPMSYTEFFIQLPLQKELKKKNNLVLVSQTRN